MAGLRRVIPASIPLVGFRSNPAWPGPQVVVSEEKGGYAGTRYLIEQGHRQILMLSGQNPFEARACGYRRALSEAGLGVYEHFVRPTNGTLAGGFEAMSSALIGPRQYTAVFCHNDFVALGAIEAIRRAGLRVPQELSVMGFDELAPSGSRGMGLSTVAMRKIELAQQALALLLECIDRLPERKEPGILELEPRVIVGETTASLSRNGSLISP
jgi:DNA-binding LacI/PurR family transcriptional regulator